ncbi:MAG: hypothetical protein ACLUKN_02120 [Bacilli bacterium]
MVGRGCRRPIGKARKTIYCIKASPVDYLCDAAVVEYKPTQQTYSGKIDFTKQIPVVFFPRGAGVC